ncbi:MAG: cytochrome c biogenesis protein CcsA [Planctomycetes bacterium]|nr:cytochrome c biogenesis protein CcsA [Planctomycetota bacterium]
MSLELSGGGHWLVGVLAAVHGGSLVLAAPGSFLKRKSLERAALVLFLAAFAINTWIMAGRWIEAGRPPFKTLYETLLFYPWCVGLVTLVLIGLHRLHVLLAFASGVSVIGLVYALTHPDVEIIHLPPALQSGWFVPHVVTYFVSYAALFASCVLALLSLAIPVFGKGEARSNEHANLVRRFESHANGAVMFGFSALTLGLVLGAVWGKYAWGDYWSWDPKENWALVTWLAYLVYLHLEMVRGWRGRRAMVLLVAAFAAVVFTYLGMSLLPTSSDSLHVYQ